MKAKRLENLLASETKLGAEMVVRFQKLRDTGLLTRSRGRNAEYISADDVVYGLLSVVASRPGYAGLTSKMLYALKPVGVPEDTFCGAPSFGQALSQLLTNESMLSQVVEVRATDSEVYNNSIGRGAIIYSQKSREVENYYVRKEATSLFGKGRHKDYNPRSLFRHFQRESVFLPPLLRRIAKEMREAERMESLLAHQTAAYSAAAIVSGS